MSWALWDEGCETIFVSLMGGKAPKGFREADFDVFKIKRG